MLDAYLSTGEPPASLPTNTFFICMCAALLMTFEK
jgi:hypothetical protein